MDEDSGAKAPVTRLRRRLSVEQTEESKSPAVNTPTKKRGGRKAKPELEPVDENTPDNTTSRRATRKAIKDVIEPEEKPVTPSRRSTRIKSNTSILSETALTIDSPRAKRAARRASTAGSDNETPITPARQTRRTRKDSTSSVEKELQLLSKQGIQITEVIIEEPEGSSNKSVPQLENTNEQSNSTNSTRRSPRLSEKTKKINQIKVTVEEFSNGIPLSEPAKDILSQNNSDSTSLPSQETSNEGREGTMALVPENKSQSEKNRLSVASAKLIKELNTKNTKKLNLNKSLSTLDGKRSESRRKRTKSWTTLSASIDSQFYSDNEGTKRKIKSPLVLTNRVGSGDGALNTSKDQDMSKKTILEKNKKVSMNFTVEIVNEPLDKFHENIAKESTDEISFSDNNTKNDMSTGELLERKPSGDIKTKIFIEDSDSNSEKTNEPTRLENEDQCVPVVEHPIEASHTEKKIFTPILNKNEQYIFNMSKRKDTTTEVEPMDIDETIPENLIIPETDTTQLNTTENKSKSTNVYVSNATNDEVVNKSGRKSSISNNLDKSGIETKSTLILSQIKDLSAGDISNTPKSPQVTNNKILSVDDLNITEENNAKKNVSLHYSTSTPLQDKNITQKFKGIHVSTPIISAQTSQATEELANLSKDKHNISKTNNDEDVKKHNISMETVTTITLKTNQGKAKKSDMETINFLSEISQSEVKEPKETSDKETARKMDIQKHAVLSEQRNERKSSNVSLHEESIKLSSKVKESTRNILSSSEESEDEIGSLDNTGGGTHLLDDEAEDAGDDYESGDSQNESDRQYEKDHEVIDKGETLTTDDDFSDDSDYEKDSFIVSSNEEDEELLDGMDDDLLMSVNELTMTEKSKKKYNERKLKEQKQASREMFESRHRLNSSNKSTDLIMGKTKKNKKQQISSSESEEDVPKKSKKNNRMRLDSTKEASLHADESEHKISKKKNIVDTDSSSDESVPNEKEMTIYDESVKDSDPLTLIKIEPKTPIKSANSTIAFIDSEEVNNDGTDKNESTKTQTEFDPLHATMFMDEDDDSISSDSEKIQNYDSVLQDLNKSNSNLKTKVCDISLTLDNKRKKKEKNTVMDELNLTQVKSNKKMEKQKEKDNSVKEILPKSDNEDEASDAIELNLLFSEESNNSDTSSVQNKMTAGKAESEDIIPLKSTQAKTDLRESKGDKGDGAIFFVDTDGTQADDITLKENHDQSTKNIYAGDKSVNKSGGKLEPEENSDDEPPLEVSYQKEKTSKRKYKIKDNVTNETESATETCVNESTAKSPASSKKNKKKAKFNESSEHTDITNNMSTAKSLLEVPTSGKKKKNQSESCSEEQTNILEAPMNDVTTIEKNKKRKKSESTFTENNEVQSVQDILEAPIIDVTVENNKKRKKSTSTSFTENNEFQSVSDNQEVPIDASSSEKKKKIKQKKSASTSFKEDNEIQSVPVVIAENETSSKKRKRKSSPSTTKEIHPAVVTAVPLNNSADGSKKKKRKVVAQDEKIVDMAPTEEEKDKQPDKKQNKNKTAIGIPNISTGIDEPNKKRNRKRKDRDEDEASKYATSKMLKENTFIKVTRLPAALLEKLEDVPSEVPRKKPKVISTTEFIVQETNKRRVKPSNYLEESIYLNEASNTRRNNKKHVEKPKVLPFVPTASTSNSGFTSKFKINVLTSDTTFVAQANNVSSFRENYLYGNKIRRLGTYDMYKRQRNMKLTKF